MFHIFIWGD